MQALIVYCSKILEPTTLLLDKLESERSFRTASDINQAKITHQLHSIVTASNDKLHLLDEALLNLDKVTTNLAALNPTASLDAPHNLTDHLKSLAISAKTLTDSADNIQKSLTTFCTQPSILQAPTTYANIVAINPPTHSTIQPSFNPNTLDFITHIENKLWIQEHQIFVTYDLTAANSPKDYGREAAHALGGKLNEWMQALDQEGHQVLNTNSCLIKLLLFTNQSAILMECDTGTMAVWLKSYINEKNLLAQICASAKLQPHSFRLILKFVPCDRSFSPDDEDQLRVIEIDHSMVEGSIILASWIKKPELRSPNQKTANIKFICASPHVTNQLLTDRVFIANTRVVIVKDTQEPIHCNRCQEYGYMCEKCKNIERCAMCAKTTPYQHMQQPQHP